MAVQGARPSRMRPALYSGSGTNTRARNHMSGGAMAQLATSVTMVGPTLRAALFNSSS